MFLLNDHSASPSLSLTVLFPQINQCCGPSPNHNHLCPFQLHHPNRHARTHRRLIHLILFIVEHRRHRRRCRGRCRGRCRWTCSSRLAILVVTVLVTTSMKASIRTVLLDTRERWTLEGQRQKERRSRRTHIIPMLERLIRICSRRALAYLGWFRLTTGKSSILTAGVAGVGTGAAAYSAHNTYPPGGGPTSPTHAFTSISDASGYLVSDASASYCVPPH